MANEQAVKSWGIASFFSRLFSSSPRNAEAAKPKPAHKGIVADIDGYTPAQQRELEYLCTQLFKRKSLVTTGKLQLIGLEKVRRQLGRRWEEQKAFVYKVAKDVIAEHIGEGDIFVRMKDDTYLIIFSDSTLSQGNAKSTAIAEEIRARLFASPVEAMHEVHVQKCVVETKTKDFSAMAFTRALDFLAARKVCPSPVAAAPAEPEKNQTPVQPSVPDAKPNIQMRYMPLWDHRKNAITMYYCSPAEGSVFPKTVAGDMAILHKVQQETARMVSDGRKFLILCPVRHETLYSQINCEAYLNKCDSMTEEQRQMLVIVVTHVPEDWKKTNGYWFAAELKKRCHYLFLEADMGACFDFTGLVRMGFDAIGITTENSGRNEQEMMSDLLALRKKCQAAGIKRNFVLGLSTLSMTTFSVCNGLDFLGGTAIHAQVCYPDGIQRYGYDDMFSQKCGG